MSHTRSTSTTQPTSTTHPQKYIIISRGNKSNVTLKSQVYTSQCLFQYIHNKFPDTYKWVNNHWEKIPLVIQTCDLPICKGNFVDIEPDLWQTIIYDINNIRVALILRIQSPP
ncbi:uncharacterized protein EV420DRAFT_1481612 [Desarmillaria tabescens]|uniref:Uncharacterized protein n=1 Tax=Armillaria tabescens TaxID=1929756 RepID=A0AA39N169_ARMTA|nr:uncharacterized protein EV420DRAFT_1481612 [Desarmillaria tabescens]KAK0454172.1 hypothetical protein EV420DRAFT_1481612 [Desarmillaria tabescens]